MIPIKSLSGRSAEWLAPADQVVWPEPALPQHAIRFITPWFLDVVRAVARHSRRMSSRKSYSDAAFDPADHRKELRRFVSRRVSPLWLWHAAVCHW